MVDVDAIREATDEDSLKKKLKKKAKGAAGTVKEKAKEKGKEAGGKVKEKAKKKYYQYKEKKKEKKAQKRREKEAYHEAKREARKKEMGRVGEAEGVSEAREMKRHGIGGSKLGRALKGMATHVQMMKEDTGGAFGTESRKSAAFIDTDKAQESLTGVGMDLDEKLDIAPKTDMLSRSKSGKSDLFGSSKKADDFFGKSKSSSKKSDLLNSKKNKKDIKFF